MTKSVFAQYGSDESLETSGTWFTINEMRFKLARAGGSNIEFLKLVRKRTAPYKRALAAGSIEEKFAREIIAGCFAETVLLDWEGVYGDDEQAIPFSKETAKDLLAKLPNLFNELRDFADNWENFKAEDLEADRKN